MRCQSCSYVYDHRKQYRCPKCKTAPDTEMDAPDLFKPVDPADLPAPKIERPHLSVSQMKMYLRCPRQYEYRYMQGIKERPAGAMIQGGAFHETVEDNLVQKIQSHTDLPLSEMTDRAAQHFDDKVQKEPDIQWKEDKPSDLKDETVLLVKTHHKELAPVLKPALVEHEFRLNVGDTHDLKGVIDLVETSGVVVDHKTFAKTPSQGDVDRDLQLTAYALARNLEDSPAPELRLDVVVKNKTPKTVQLKTTRTENDLMWFVTMFTQIEQAIKSGVFPPNPTGWHCSKEMCGYWDRCKTRV